MSLISPYDYDYYYYRLDNHARLKVLVEAWTSQHKIDDIVTLLLNNRVSAPVGSICFTGLVPSYGGGTTLGGSRA